jgi:nucleotide-binding universal stress UspA family protein
MKILIAVDDSASSKRAVAYATGLFGKADNVSFGLVHVLPNLPAIFWDEGHILSDVEKQDRKKVVDKWLDAQKAKIEPLFKSAKDQLTAQGAKAIETKFVSDSTDVADSLLEEARDGKYGTVVVGRSHHSPKHVLGTVAGKLAAQGSGLVVTIVE